VASTYRYLRRLSPCNFRANCTETRMSLIYRTEPTTKKWKTEKVKSKKTDMLRSINKQSGEFM